MVNKKIILIILSLSIIYKISAQKLLTPFEKNNNHTATYTEGDIRTIFAKALNGVFLTKEEVLQFKSAMLYELAIWDWEKGWTQQFHLGAIRNNNSRFLRELGKDIGVDSIGDFPMAVSMSRFFDRLDGENKLAKTIIYNLNPADNEVFASMIGNFQDGARKFSNTGRLAVFIDQPPRHFAAQHQMQL